MPRIETLRVGSQKPLHLRHQSLLRHLHHQVKIISHQRIGMPPPNPRVCKPPPASSKYAGPFLRPRLGLRRVHPASLHAPSRQREFVDSKKFGHEGIGRIVAHFGRGASLLDCAFVDEDDAVGDFEGLVLVVRNENRGESCAVVEFTEPAAQIFTNLSVERTKGLVQQEHLGAVGQSASECDPLALTSGKLCGKAFLVAFQLNGAQEFTHPFADGRFRRALGAREHPKGKGDVLIHIHVIEERVVLENEACLALVGGEAGDIAAMEENVPIAGIGEFQAGNDTEQRRLARAAWPKEGDEFALADVEGYLAQGGMEAESFGNVLYGNAHGAIVDEEARSSCSARHSARVLRMRVIMAKRPRTEATAKADANWYSL